MYLIGVISQSGCRYEDRTVVGYQLGSMWYAPESITALLFFNAIQAGEELSGIIEIEGSGYIWI